MPDLPRIPAPDVKVRITADVAKLCPVKDEIDTGTVTLTYQTEGSALELHGLRAYLDRYATVRLSHEEFTRRVADDTGAEVESAWTTADMKVTCTWDIWMR